MKKIKLIALFAALIAGLGLYQLLKEIGKPQETPRTAVVVAAVNIPENTLITEEMVALQAVATEAVLPDHVQNPESVIGMALSSDVYAGEQILTDRLVRMGESAAAETNTLAYVVENGMRAVSVAVSSTTGIANMLKPGNRVDLVMNYTEERETDDPEKTETIPASRILLQNVEVLAVGSVLSKDGAAEYATVTLQVTPEEAAMVSLAEFVGNIRLILRSSLDSELTGEVAVNMDALSGSGKEMGP